ncbi:hypothetical protein [Pseudoduganella armeniaca]|uniref:Uncharacterized protein n=1 Tax=Pseudoduganella armeniaca TaxID=2072590 RepID=A0A2R4C871_9BURK|nr:hypothetical protein [Pseudoduganella armeniaca]AVR95748.1 hypothetical protein C9I28_08410 [Pseudoduganella armeniaca]
MLRDALSTPHLHGDWGLSQCLICASGKISSWLASCVSGHAVLTPSRLPDSGLVQVIALTTVTVCLSRAGSCVLRIMPQPDSVGSTNMERDSDSGKECRYFMSGNDASDTSRLTDVRRDKQGTATGVRRA